MQIFKNCQGGMRITYILFTGICYIILIATEVFSYWEWTPERGRWINPKYYVAETSSEQWKYAMSVYEAGDYKTAQREFKKLIKHFPTSEEAGEAQFMIGKCYEKQQRLYEACKSYQEVINKYPSTERLREIVERQVHIANQFYNRSLERQSIVVKTKEFFTETNWDKAATIYKMVIENHPYYEKADEVQYRIGECYLKTGKYEVARVEFGKVASTYPDSPLVDDAEYQIGMCWIYQSRNTPYNEEIIARAIRSLEDFLGKYPESELVSKAKEKLKTLRNRKGEKIYQIAYFYERTGEVNAARIYYQYIIDEFPTSIWAERSKSRLEEISSSKK